MIGWDEDRVTRGQARRSIEQNSQLLGDDSPKAKVVHY